MMTYKHNLCRSESFNEALSIEGVAMVDKILQHLWQRGSAHLEVTRKMQSNGIDFLLQKNYFFDGI